MQQHSVTQLINPNLAFGDLHNNTTALWSLLLFSGYLTATDAQPDKLSMRCKLVIPNQEIRYLYEEIIRQWFTDRIDPEDYLQLLNSLASGQLDSFERRLRRYLRESISYFDASGYQPEKFYHGFILGLIAGLADTHIIYSNRESGDGRYDVAVLPKGENTANYPGIILEFKQVENSEHLEKEAEQALTQIDQRWYQTELEQHGIQQILTIGLAFSGKTMAMRSRC